MEIVSKENKVLLDKLEQLIMEALSELVMHGSATFKVPRNRREREDIEKIHSPFRRVSYNNNRSRHRFCLLIYMLAEIHRLLAQGGSCTVRGLYYRNTQLIRAQSFIVAAKLDVCRILNTAPFHLGILSASKGLLAGDIRMIMSNGDVLDGNAYGGAISLPIDFENVDHIDTRAELVLVVEKESVFESLLSRNIFSSFGIRLILVTGKGYPDCSTRRLVHRLTMEFNLPTYILVDADPFGIEIMLVYRHGSQSMNFTSNLLASPSLRWVGLHPSEIFSLAIGGTAPLSREDNKKINDMLNRKNMDPGVRQELYKLQQMQLKAEIESVLDFLCGDYIPNKVNRNLFL
ncbi:meiotic recombination protein W68 [Drosophila tropicalis]|uniref:meiotic recombination protein W68 n=1 Tax=Drosophila tropicalis TaxID=46794 RepID=UPI0035ABC6A7